MSQSRVLLWLMKHAPTMVSGQSMRWFWEALENAEFDLVRSLTPHDFDWNTQHPRWGTPLMAMVAEVIRSPRVLEDPKAKEAIMWMLAQGADPRLEAPSAMAPGWTLGGDAQFPKLQAIAHRGHSAITLTLAIRNEMTQNQANRTAYTNNIQGANAMLKLFSTFRTRAADDSSVRVDEGVVDHWDRILLDTKHADVEFQITDASGEEVIGRVRAHSLILENASNVLRATLTGGMCEAQIPKVVKVPGASVEAVQELMCILYTGCFRGQEEPSVSSLLNMLDVAHRWSADHLVTMIEINLMRRMSLEELGALAEAAEMKQLAGLRNACMRFAQDNSKEVKDQLAGEQLSQAAKRLLGPAFGGSYSEEPERKRRRRLCVH